jgi:Ribonuclease G/E
VYVEQWLPPDKYGSPDTWNTLQADKIDGFSYDLLGPFPARGDYEMLLMLETPHREGCETVAVEQYDGCYSCRGGRFIEPTSFIVDQITRLVERSRNRSERDRMNDTKDLMENWSKDFDNEADDRIKDLQSSFNSQTVFMSGTSKSR